MINFDVNWYGTYNRLSALSDCLELLALRSSCLTEADIADGIRDASWTSLLKTRMSHGDAGLPFVESEDEYETDLAQQQSDSREQVGNLMSVLRQRKDLLGDLYPFHVGKDDYILQRIAEPERGMYLVLLALTVGHAAKIQGLPRKIPYIFEDALEASLQACGLATSCLGKAARLKSNFSNTLAEACNEVGLRSDSSRAPHRKFANEEGCDTISNLFPRDTRSGGVQIIGQATCAKSDDWKKKLMEPPIGSWRKWTFKDLPQFAFLSVPHHVEEDTRNYLVQIDDARDVVDRVRLAQISRAPSSEELCVAELVFESDVSLFD